MNNKITLNKDGSIRKSGSGRKKGAISFCNVTMTDLKKYVGEETPIPVSRVWLENLGINISVEKKPTVKAVEKQQEEPEQKISFSLTTYDK